MNANKRKDKPLNNIFIFLKFAFICVHLLTNKAFTFLLVTR